MCNWCAPRRAGWSPWPRPCSSLCRGRRRAPTSSAGPCTIRTSSSGWAGRVRSLADLRGASFAYSDPLSNSGFLYMQHRLRGLGEDPVRYFGRSFFTQT